MKLRFIIILGLLLLVWNSCRHNETKAPRRKKRTDMPGLTR